ncbi:putative 3-deoxy-7-phosphoheptulonate synthase [Gleimia coleocanis DSM 15436]|uniref:Phospho-2-dehydro-3-deoxyheptonate aldolase n=1 Tax=Gleimia coleocanis DSM 15436 TaxID=525245 RepID=C0W1U6_9ACTO|nr:3-deoxy-7-phosphoheptulonate synthase class II [Gleimia coleocanis]EEH63462.1 putative 3-deoxy-7-phosphoheptulonate synthase [Gleimia coleocanis DSM 15436]
MSISETNALETWRNLPALQQPDYADLDQLRQIIEVLRQRPGLVFATEIERLTKEIARAGSGDSFVLMGGDCAETFASTTEAQIRLKIQTMLQMGVVLSYGAALPVVKIGRIAGQYAKPRTNALETREGVSLPAYRGDAVNGIGFSASEREADPARLLEMYQHCSATLNLMRAFTKGGFADLNLVHTWNEGFTSNPAYARYESLAADIQRALRFMVASGAEIDGLKDVDFYASHEALLLEYESAMVRKDPLSGQLYNTSGHFLWIGERTRIPEGAHVELLSKVRNPIGVKLGPTGTAEDVLQLASKLNPANEPGKFTVITRMGADKIADVLPPVLERVKAEGIAVTWLTDPMHGNTIHTSSGIKTRHFDTVMREVEGFFVAHRQVGTVAGGLHIELTGDDVTEVLGGAFDLNELDLEERYESLVDPRLNHQQSLEMAFKVAELL